MILSRFLRFWSPWQPAACRGNLLFALRATLLATGTFAFPIVTTSGLASAAVTTPRSRTHRLGSALTPMHYTERSYAVPHTGKAAAKHAPTAAAGTKGKRGAGKSAPVHGHHHSASPDPEEAFPMHRTGRDTSRAGAGHHAQASSLRQQAQRNFAHTSRHAAGRHASAQGNSEQTETTVAEVTGRSANGDYLATLHGVRSQRRGAWASTASRSGQSVVVLAAPPTPSTGSGAYGNAAGSRNPAPVQRQPPSTMQASQAYGTAYASGIANPQDDRSSYRATGPLRSAAAPAAASPGTGYVAQAPAGTMQATGATVQAANRAAPAPQVIGGFGSELALAPAQPSDRPGTTRRRNHPLAASALPEDAKSTTPAVLAGSLPNTLFEREAITEAAVSPAILPDLYDRDGRLVMPAPLKGSREVLVHQNTMADNDGLERIANNAELDHLRATRQLVDLPASGSLRVNEDLPYNRRAARPWTALFTQDIARDYYARFHQPLWVTSAVRTVAVQSHLLRVNGNAAGLYGDFASPHLTGQAVDFGKRGMTAAQLAWMRSYLLPLIQSGKIDVEEEFQQACFHISVYRRYAGGRHIVSEMAQVAAPPAVVPAVPLTAPPATRVPLPGTSSLRTPATSLPLDGNENNP